MTILLTILFFSRTHFMVQAISHSFQNEKGAFISSYFGERKDPFTRRETFHSGIDLAGNLGMKVRAIGPGRIVFVGYFAGYGNLVVIRHAQGITSHYAHLGSVRVHVGEFVNKRNEVGTLGDSGRSTGPHLHFEMRLNGRPFNPLHAL